MPEVDAKTKLKETAVHLGLRKIIPKVELYSCNQDLALMANELA